MSEERAQKFHADDVSLPDAVSASDWLKQIFNNQFSAVTCHQYGISARISSPQTSFRGETVASVATYRLFS